MKTKPSIYLRWQGYYDYTEENVIKHVLKDPRLPGVYKIAELQTFGVLVPFYVGQTDNLNKTLLNHLNEKEKNECLKKEIEDKICCFKFAPVIEEKERKDILFTLYEHYHPFCNKEIKEGSSVKINFQ